MREFPGVQMICNGMLCGQVMNRPRSKSQVEAFYAYSKINCFVKPFPFLSRFSL